MEPTPRKTENSVIGPKSPRGKPQHFIKIEGEELDAFSKEHDIPLEYVSKEYAANRLSILKSKMTNHMSPTTRAKYVYKQSIAFPKNEKFRLVFEYAEDLDITVIYKDGREKTEKMGTHYRGPTYFIR